MNKKNTIHFFLLMTIMYLISPQSLHAESYHIIEANRLCYSHQGLAESYNQDSQIEKRFINSSSSLIAEDHIKEDNSTTQWIIQDNVDTPVISVNREGIVTHLSFTDPYGQSLFSATSDDSESLHQDFNGKKLDQKSSQWHNFDIRGYNSLTGLFLQIDSEYPNFLYQSPYLGFNGDPINFSDPTGAQAEQQIPGINSQNDAIEHVQRIMSKDNFSPADYDSLDLIASAFDLYEASPDTTQADSMGVHSSQGNHKYQALGFSTLNAYWAYNEFIRAKNILTSLPEATGKLGKAWKVTKAGGRFTGAAFWALSIFVDYPIIKRKGILRYSYDEAVFFLYKMPKFLGKTAIKAGEFAINLRLDVNVEYNTDIILNPDAINSRATNSSGFIDGDFYLYDRRRGIENGTVGEYHW